MKPKYKVHKGDKMPVGGSWAVEVVYRDGDVCKGDAEMWVGWNWDDEPVAGDQIVAYRVIEPHYTDPELGVERKAGTKMVTIPEEALVWLQSNVTGSVNDTFYKILNELGE